MIGKGIFEFDAEIDGTKKKIGFKFGMYAAAVSERIAGCSIIELFDRIHGKRIEGKDNKGNPIVTLIPGQSTISLLHYFYGGAVAYSKDETIDIDTVSDYIDAIGLKAAMEVFTKSISTYTPKNNQAPELAADPGQSIEA